LTALNRAVANLAVALEEIRRILFVNFSATVRKIIAFSLSENTLDFSGEKNTFIPWTGIAKLGCGPSKEFFGAAWSDLDKTGLIGIRLKERVTWMKSTIYPGTINKVLARFRASI
jgi:hypothetical protein